uniref:Rab9 effector protein with kelch motifs n=1 Tax=Cyprinodon variegatus TaxID=28743 RepID=A0A3Q2FMA0_CYPVA
MALASGHWLEKEVRGEPPSPHGHALAVAGSVAFLFGGSCSISPEVSPVYFSDFHMLTTPDEVSWEEIPQSGEVPAAREGHTLLVKGKLFLFGGASRPEASECLPGVYSFDVSLTWECLSTSGVAPRGLRHSSAAAGDNIYVYGGVVKGDPTDDLLVFNTFAQAGDQVFMFGGYGAGGEFCKNLYVLNTKLHWQRWEVKGDCPAACTGQTLTAHHEKDIYLFGGKFSNKDATVTSSNEIHKLKMKWKVPLYVGIPPARRHGHAAFILHSHLYIFGGRNEEQDFNDLKVMKLINPSERQPSFTPTKVPNVRYELNLQQVHVHRDFSAVRDQAMKMIQAAFTLLDQEFQKLDQELKEMLEKHRWQNEAWLRARAEENDRERREICRLRQEEVLQDQERLKEEQDSVQKRSQHLLSIMQQFKGM